MSDRTGTRSKMIATASTLLQRQGYAATGWRQVVNESETDKLIRTLTEEREELKNKLKQME